jgi:hypothetical protein
MADTFPIPGPGFRSRAELGAALAAGGRFVFFEYCISLIVITLRRPSRVYFLPAGRWGWWHGLRYSLVSAVFGWWGVPWGLILTPIVLFGNLAGGRDVTAQVVPEWTT